MMQLIPPALGLVLLLMGRRLFWVFLAVAGFVAGLQAVPLVLGPQPFWVSWVAGLIGGLIGALLALFFQQVAIVVGGFLAGVTLALHILPAASASTVMLVSLGCGVAGAMALFLFFDWVLVFLSAMIGALLVVDSMGPHLPWTMVGYVFLVALGIVFQLRWMPSRRGMAP